MHIGSQLSYGASRNIKTINLKEKIINLKEKTINIITFYRDLRKMCSLYRDAQKNMSDPESSSSCIIDHNYNNVLLVVLESLR